MNMDYDAFRTILDDLKYTQRLSKYSFKELLFSDATDEYLDAKWDMFRETPLYFLWSCSPDKLALICEYVNQHQILDKEE